MTRSELLQNKRDDILRIAKKRGAEHVRIFGSVVRGDDSNRSDIDILVVMLPGQSLLDLVGLDLDLKDLLGCEVDVVDEKALSPYIRDQILAEAVTL